MTGTAFIKHFNSLSANELDDAYMYIDRLIERHLLPADYITGSGLDAVKAIYIKDEIDKRRLRYIKKGA